MKPHAAGLRASIACVLALAVPLGAGPTGSTGAASSNGSNPVVPLVTPAGPDREPHAPPPNHCVRPLLIKLNLLVDISNAMQYVSYDSYGRRYRSDTWKADAAAQLAFGIFDGFNDVGELGAAGALSIPTGYTNYAVAGDAATLGNVEAFATFPGWIDLTSVAQNLFFAIQSGANHLGTVGGDGRVLVVISHVGNDGSGTEADAARAIAASGAATHLVYVGDPSRSDDAGRPIRPNSYGSLSSIASSSGARFHSVSSLAAVGPVIDAVLAERGCANWAPTVVATREPATLYLGTPDDTGTPSYTVTFDATGTTDPETRFEDLVFRWTLTRPDGSAGPTHNATGLTGALWPVTFSMADRGRWDFHVEVDDGDGGVHTRSGDFVVSHSPPVIEMHGGGTIDVLEELRVWTAVTRDYDGGDLTYSWRQLSGPYPTEQPLDAAEIRWVTAARDITVFSDDTRYAGTWELELTVTDDEGASVSETARVEVRNLPVQAEIDGPARLEPGDALTLRSVNNSDPDGGDDGLVRSWDVVQSPQNDADAASYRVGYEVSTAEVFGFTLGDRDAGAWIFRLNLTDDEGEATVDSILVHVPAPPVAAIESPGRIGSTGSPLRLSGEFSYDPDSPCDPPEYCHEHLEGTVHDVTPGIERWSWTLRDVPPEHQRDFPAAGIEEVLEVPGHEEAAEIPAGTLPPGLWTFQLEVEDAEGDADSDHVQVEVLDDTGAPMAVLSAPARFDVDAGGFPVEAVTISSNESIDPDNLPAGPLPGIQERQWEMLDGPDGCAVPEPTDANALSWTLFPFGTAVPPECHGAFTVQLIVVDDDRPTARRDTTRSMVLVGNCPDPVCIDSPRGDDPAIVEPGDPVDIPIVYHIDSALRGDPGLPHGVSAQLAIFHYSDPTTAVYKAFSPGLDPSRAGSPLAFHWSGHHGTSPPRPGLYDVEISLVDAGGSLVHTAREVSAIALPLAEEILDCGALWEDGFPDRPGGAYPCVEFRPPFSASSANYRVFFAPYWDQLAPEHPRYLRWTAQAARESWEALATLGPMPPVAVVLAPGPLPSPEYEGHDAATYSRWGEPFEPCPVIVYSQGLEEGHLEYKQTLAHELAHCFQGHNFEAGDRWWNEATAVFLSNHVYPATNAEHGWTESFVHDWEIYFDPQTLLPADDPRYLHPYAAGIFFQSLANDPAIGAAGVVALMGRLGSGSAAADPAVTLNGMPWMADAMSRFALEWIGTLPGGVLGSDGFPLRWTRVRDPGGGTWPALWPEPGAPLVEIGGASISSAAPEVRVSGRTIAVSYEPFSITDLQLSFERGYIYRVSVSPDAPHRRIRVPPPRHALGPSAPLPAEVRPGCRGAPDMTVIVTNTEPASTHELRITVDAVPDPACR